MFGRRLRALREEKGITQRELADAVKLSASTIGMYESGRRDPDSATLQQLAGYFGVSTDYLLGRADRRNGDNPDRETALPPGLVEAINSLPEESRRVFLRARNLSPEGLRSVVDYIRFKLNEEEHHR